MKDLPRERRRKTGPSLGRCCETQSEGDVETERPTGGLAGRSKMMTVRKIGKSAPEAGNSQPDRGDLSGDGARHDKKDDATTL